MKYQDHQLLEEAYDRVLLKEGRDDEVGLSDSEYYDAMDDADNERYDAAGDADDDREASSFNEFIELTIEFMGKEIYVSGNVYGEDVYVDDSFDHAFGTEEGHHFEKNVEGITDLVIDFAENDSKEIALTPETIGGPENYQKLVELAKEMLKTEVEAQ